MYVSGEDQMKNVGCFFFFLVWEGFQYNLVKHNELTKGAFRVSEIYTFTLQKFSLSLFPMCAQ